MKVENQRKEKLLRNEIARKAKPRVRRMVNDNRNSKVGYGENCGPDMEPEALKLAIGVQIAKMDANKAKRESIQTDTIGQRHCLNWLNMRKELINSEYFSKIVNARGRKSYTNILAKLMYEHNEFAKTADLRHQRLFEVDALNCFSLVYPKHSLQSCGIFIDKEYSFLGASPLLLYGPDSIVVVKCPRKEYNKTFDDAIGPKSLKFWKKVRGNVSVNVNHEWFIEIQGDLHITGRKLAHLVIWLKTEFKIVKVKRVDSFWETKLKDKLCFFFNEW